MLFWILKLNMMGIQKFASAPGFILYDTERNKVSLHDQREQNVLLLFFPLAFSGTCTKELSMTRDNLALYNSVDAKIFGISVDSLYVLKRYKEELQLNFTLLSDFNREASKAFDVLYEVFPTFEMKGVSKRASFVIDKKGIVQYSEVCASPGDLPDFNKIQTALKELQKK
jgi:peroxiredoxin